MKLPFPLRTALVATALLFLLSPLHAQVPTLVNYQGRVAVGAVNFEGAGQFKFALVNSDGTVSFWSNDGSSTIGDEPATAVALTVEKGLYSVLLGDAMTAIPATVFANPDVRLRVWFNDGVNGSQLLAPDQRLAPSVYVADGAVTTPALADAAITTAKIAPAAIDGTHVAAGSLDFSHLFVPAAPGSGQVLGFNGTGLAWTAPGSGDGIWTQVGPLAYRLDEIAVGTAAANPGIKLTVAGNLQVLGSTGGHTFQIGSPNSETGFTITGTGRADYRFDGTYLKMLAGPAGQIPQFSNGIVIDTGGNIGFGTAPAHRFHLKHPISLSQVIETTGGTNAFSLLQLKNGNGAWNVVTSRGFNNDSFIVARHGGDVMKFWLDANEFAAGFTVADLLLGHPSRRGAPGRALVDNGTSLVVNFGNDWGTTVIGGAVTEVTTLRINGADLVEPFPIKEAGIEKGSVVVIDEENPGALRRSTQAYDPRVAGIVSGANGIRAGIVLRQEGVLDQGENVALSGRVYVKADASYGAIRPGDLLTTSETPGHAMKATDRERTPGAVLGKAMTRLDEGQGQVLVLVTLQ